MTYAKAERVRMAAGYCKNAHGGESVKRSGRSTVSCDACLESDTAYSTAAKHKRRKAQREKNLCETVSCGGTLYGFSRYCFSHWMAADLRVISNKAAATYGGK